MKKTTVYLPDDVKAALTAAAAQRGVSEADVIRQALRKEVAPERRRPRSGLYSGTEPIAERVDVILRDGYGTQ